MKSGLSEGADRHTKAAGAFPAEPGYEPDPTELMAFFSPMRDISGIALRYSVPNVLLAIRQVVREYIETDRAVKNVGALIRTYAKANAAFSDEVNSLHAG